MSGVHVVEAWFFPDGITSEPVGVEVLQATVTMDEKWSPYLQIDAECSLLESEEELEVLDPRNSPLVYVSIGLDAVSRHLRVHLRERVVNHNAATMSLTMESGEALLQDFALAARSADTQAMLLQESLVTLINYHVFPRVLWRENLARHAVVDDAWKVAAGTAIYRETPASEGVFLDVTATGSVTYPSVGIDGEEDRVEPGKTYTYAFRASSSHTGGPFYVRAFDGSDKTAIASVTHPSGVNTVSWTLYSVTFTAPESGIVYLSLRWDAGVVGRHFYANRLTLVQDDEPLAWDPPQLTTVNGDHDFTADAEALTWQPGESAWDYLEPLLQTAGLRLFADEFDQWHLVNADHHVQGQINASRATNVTEAEDAVSRYRDWFDCVVIEYAWTDSNGDAQKAWDVAGAPGSKVLKLTYERPFPGAGAAAAVLQRSNSQGRTADVTMLSRYGATPGQTLRMDLPKLPLQTGVASSVQWTFPEGLMTLGSRQLTDTPPTAWIAGEVGQSWNDGPVGDPWIEETI